MSWVTRRTEVVPAGVVVVVVVVCTWAWARVAAAHTRPQASAKVLVMLGASNGNRVAPARQRAAAVLVSKCDAAFAVPASRGPLTVRCRVAMVTLSPNPLGSGCP